jgi:hypothetical protein
VRIAAAGLGLLAIGYGVAAASSWCRYGHPSRPRTDEETDPLLDRFMPDYDIVERHQIRVHAPAAITLQAAQSQDLQSSPLVRLIFKARELALGSTSSERPRDRALLPELLSLGWGVLAEVPGHETVVGAVTRPWTANVVFHAVSAAEFAAFHEADYVKIVVSLRADAVGPADSIFRTETRAVATDRAAAAKFRRYWAFVSPGVALIRRFSLGPVKADAERRARDRGADGPAPVHRDHGQA